MSLWAYGLSHREENTWRAYENRVLRKILGPMREEVPGCWRKLNNEKLHNLYSAPNILRVKTSRRMR
jgi:hypothetical protein